MTVILIIVGVLVVVGSCLYVHDRLSRCNIVDEETQIEDESAGECCGMHISCEKDSLLASVSNDIVYYDDEELDVYAGRKATDYKDEEIEQFRDVLLTLLPQDIAGWGRSIQLRGIELPTVVREELIMIVAEARQITSKH